MRRARHLAPGLDQQLLAALAHQAARQRVQQQGEAAGHQVYVEEAEHGGRGAVQVRAVDQPQQPLHQHRHEPLGPAQRVEPRYGLGARDVQSALPPNLLPDQGQPRLLTVQAEAQPRSWPPGPRLLQLLPHLPADIDYHGAALGVVRQPLTLLRRDFCPAFTKMCENAQIASQSQFLRCFKMFDIFLSTILEQSGVSVLKKVDSQLCRIMLFNIFCIFVNIFQ